MGTCEILVTPKSFVVGSLQVIQLNIHIHRYTHIHDMYPYMYTWIYVYRTFMVLEPEPANTTVWGLLGCSRIVSETIPALGVPPRSPVGHLVKEGSWKT